MALKQTFVLFLITFFGVSGATGQITLTSADYPPSLIGVDSLKKTMVGSSFPILAPSLNGIWDMTVVTDTMVAYFSYRVTGISSYAFADSSAFFLVNYAYGENIESNIIPSGVMAFSAEIYGTSRGIFFLTGNPYDSLIIPSQNATYSSPQTKIAFPATISSSWQSTYSYDVDFQLSYLAGGDTLAPGIIRTYISETDSVVGWGKMRVTDANGSPSDYNNVLQVQTRIIQTDSFFLNGVPFSSPLLLVLQLKQGHKDTTYQQNFYRKRELTPLAQVNFRDAGYTQPFKATTHVQRLSTTESLVIAGSSIRVYPNPADEFINVNLPDVGSWTYELSDIAGRPVLSGLMHAPGGAIHIPHGTPSGTYHIRLSRDGKTEAVKALTLRAK